MVQFTIGEQTVLQVVICFSFANILLAFTFHKEKTFCKMLGLSFLLPFALSLFILYHPGSGHPLFAYINFIFLICLNLLALLWFKKYYFGSLIMVLLFPVLCLLLIKNKPPIPEFLVFPPLLIALTICLSGVVLTVFRKVILEKDLDLTWAVLILGCIQTLQFLAASLSPYFIALGNFGGYLLFFMYILKKTREPYLTRIKKAESKLADMNKTIRYEVKRKILEIERHNEHLQKLIQKDPLVDAYNKKGILNLLKEMIEEPGGEPFTVMLFDIDNFKGINDTQGHIAGDMVLKKIANMAKENIRGFDMLGRYGGDEFLIILPGTTVSDAMFVAERFRKRVSCEPNISVSIGLAAYPDDGKTVQRIIEVADAGLYESKRIGKNAVSHHVR